MFTGRQRISLATLKVHTIEILFFKNRIKMLLSNRLYSQTGTIVTNGLSNFELVMTIRLGFLTIFASNIFGDLDENVGETFWQRYSGENKHLQMA